MTKSPLTIETIKAMQVAGREVEAEAACREWLVTHPDDVQVMHLLALLYAQAGKLPAAQCQLEQALQVEPDNASLQLHLANMLRAQGLFEQAIELLLKLTQAHPDFAPAFNNLGTIYYASQQWQTAVDAFQTAINKQAAYVDAYYNLGLALSKLNRHTAALHAYEAVATFDPAHPGAIFQLGCLAMQREDYQKAVDYFAPLEKQHPFHLETQINLANAYLHLGRLYEAKAHYLKALEIAPADTQVLFNLGVIEMHSGHVQDAIDYYLRAVRVDADFFDAHHNLGTAYLMLKNHDTAVLHYREALRLQPGNEAVKHLVSVLQKDKTVTAAPARYIQSLFDSYADHYESHLQSLHYAVPALFYELVTSQFGVEKKWAILDVGCGTGLCGQRFKPLANLLVGIDLSEKMLAIAASKHCYDELIHADIVPFLQDTPSSYDLILAADVLVYNGKLEEWITAIKRVLRKNGLFVFNLEISPQDDYLMTASGRFAHHKTYIDRLLADNGFKTLQYRAVTLREQDHVPVAGHLYLCQAG